MKPFGDNDSIFGAFILHTVVYTAQEQPDTRKQIGRASLTCFIIGGLCAAVAIVVNL